MTKHQKFDALPHIDRRSFIVGTAATGLVIGYAAPRRSANRLPLRPPTPSRASGTSISPDGKVWVTVGKADMGQHIASTMAQLVAEELEASWKDMNVVLASNDPKYNDPILGAAGDRRQLVAPA